MKQYWQEIYKQKKHISLWPWSDLISEFKSLNINKKINILEIGCGSGANIPFFLKQNCNYHAIDKSSHIINKLKKKYPKLKKNLIISNLLNDFSFKKKQFDLIFDRAAISHNHIHDIRKIIYKSTNLLQNKGYFIGIDWYSESSSEYKKTRKKNSLTFNKGTFKSLGPVYFFSKKEIEPLFVGYKLLSLKEKKEKDFTKNNVLSSWRFIAQKKK